MRLDKSCALFFATKIDTRGPGAPVLVFNTLGWSRSDIAVVNAGFGGARTLRHSVRPSPES